MCGDSSTRPRRATSTPTPFGKALDKPDDIVDELTRNAIRLNPLIKRHVIDGFEGVPEDSASDGPNCRRPTAMPSPSDCSPTATTSPKSRSRTAKRVSSPAPIRTWTRRNSNRGSSSSKRKPLTLADGPRLGHAASRNPKNGARHARRRRGTHAGRSHDVARLMAQNRQPIHA